MLHGALASSGDRAGPEVGAPPETPVASAWEPSAIGRLDAFRAAAGRAAAHLCSGDGAPR